MALVQWFHQSERMARNARSIEELTLALMCRASSLSATRIGAITPDDWVRILDWSVEHRFAPYLHYSLGQAGLRGSLPTEVRAQLQQAYRRATLRALSMQRDMLHVNSVLQGAGIEHLFMKGAYLAQFAYPEPGLRPLRDLDVLVRPEQAMDAFQVLQDNGLERIARNVGNPHAHLAHGKHLPPLRIPGRALVEVHTLTMAPNSPSRHAVVPGQHDTLAVRMIRRDVGGTAICFEGAEDLLLHLCVHAAVDHQFNNGPLILSDIAWLMNTHTIDWPLVWNAAREQGATRGLALVLRLVEREWPEEALTLPVQWSGDSAGILPADAPILDIAARSLLQNVAARGDVALQAEMGAEGSLSGKAARLLRRAFPGRVELAREFPVRAESPWVYAWYPAKWWRLCRRFPDFLHNLLNARARTDAENVGAISAWLRE